MQTKQKKKLNGGSIIGLIVVLGVVGSAIGLACGIGYATRDSDVGTKGGPLH